MRFAGGSQSRESSQPEQDSPLRSMTAAENRPRFLGSHVPIPVGGENGTLELPERIPRDRFAIHDRVEDRLGVAVIIADGRFRQTRLGDFTAFVGLLLGQHGRSPVRRSSRRKFAQARLSPEERLEASRRPFQSFDASGFQLAPALVDVLGEPVFQRSGQIHRLTWRNQFLLGELLMQVVTNAHRPARHFIGGGHSSHFRSVEGFDLGANHLGLFLRHRAEIDRLALPVAIGEENAR